MREANGNQLTKSNEIKWQPLGKENTDGFFVKSLMFDAETNRSLAILLKCKAGATHPLHKHLL